MEHLKKKAQLLGLGKAQMHFFLCVRNKDSKCCPLDNSQKLWEKLKKICSQHNQTSPDNQVLRSQASCLRVCQKGPVMVIYPQGLWYHSVDEALLEEIFQKYVTDKKQVTRNLFCLNQ